MLGYRRWLSWWKIVPTLSIFIIIIPTTYKPQHHKGLDFKANIKDSLPVRLYLIVFIFKVFTAVASLTVRVVIKFYKRFMMFLLLSYYYSVFTRSNNLTITSIFAIIIALDRIFVEISQSESIREFLIWILLLRVSVDSS